MHRAAITCLLVLSLVAVEAAAQQAADQRTQQALARAQGLLRQIGQQKQDLEVANAKLNASMASLKKKLRRSELNLEDASADLASVTRAKDRTDARVERLETQLKTTTEKLREAIAQYRKTVEALNQTKFEKSELQGKLSMTEGDLKQAEEKNLELYSDNREILRLYKNKSRWDDALQAEPVTGLKAVAVESVVDKYEYEMYDHVLERNLELAREIKQSAPLLDNN